MTLLRIIAAVLAALSLSAIHPGATASAQTEAEAGTEEFTLRAGDLLRIRIWPNDDLGGEFPVEETGIVHLPILGGIRAGGRSLAELRIDLRQRYGQALKSPVISVTPVFPVSVLGAVQRPGLYQVTPSQNLFEVISLAGGFREDANDREIRIVRDDGVTEVNAREALSSEAAAAGVRLRSGDRIVVERRRSFNFQNVSYALQSVTLVVAIVNLFR